MTLPDSVPTRRDLFWSFLKLGTVSFGGPAIVAYIRRLAVEQRGWLDADAFAQGNALCQTVPGAISVQMAFYVGMRLQGVAGGFASVAGYVCVPFFCVLILSILYCRLHHLPDIAAVARNLHVLVIAMLVHATYLISRSYLQHRVQCAIALGAGLLFAFGVHPVIVVCLSGGAVLMLSAGRCAGRTRTSKHNSPSRVTGKLLFGLVAGVVLFLGALYAYDGALFRLALLMVKIDFFAFGGGYTSVPLMLHEIVTVRGLLDTPTLLDGIALGQITPGPVALTATFIGYLLHGVIGALVATVSVFLASCAVMVGCMPFYERVLNSRVIHRIAEGVLCSFVGLIAWTTLHLGLQMDWSVGSGILSFALGGALLLGVPLPGVVAAGVLCAVAMR